MNMILMRAPKKNLQIVKTAVFCWILLLKVIIWAVYFQTLRALSCQIIKFHRPLTLLKTNTILWLLVNQSGALKFHPKHSNNSCRPKVKSFSNRIKFIMKFTKNSKTTFNQFRTTISPKASIINNFLPKMPSISFSSRL